MLSTLLSTGECQIMASEEIRRIADWVRLTATYRDWGFDLRVLPLRYVRDFGWNHKRVHRGALLA